jgi:Fe-S-cluster containining protein
LKKENKRKEIRKKGKKSNKKIIITRTTPLAKILELGKICSRKNNCCRHGSGFLAGDDLKNIARFLKTTEEKVKLKYFDEVEMFNKKLLRPKKKQAGRPYGECIFFDNGCIIHTVKPLQCKTGNCSEYGEELSAWFLLNYIVDKDDPESIRQYAVYLESGGKKIKGGELSDLVPDKKTLRKILSYEILR